LVTRSLEESVFWEILYRGHAVRSELASLFDVSAATISRAVAQLLTKRLIKEAETELSDRGRRAAILKINSELSFVGGIEMDRNAITAVVTDLSGTLLGRGTVASDAAQPVNVTLESCRNVLNVALEDAGMAGVRLASVGVGHTGTLDLKRGICLEWSSRPHWRQVNLLGELEGTLGLPVVLEDRGRALALAHHLLWPEYRRHHSAVHVHVGTGVGAGIFVQGRLLRGASAAAGELGHISIERNGPACWCGRRGCVEAFTSTAAILSQVKSALERGESSLLSEQGKALEELRLEDVLAAARRGDTLVSAVFTQAGEALGAGIANVVQMINPSLIVLSGKLVTSARDLWLSAINRTVREQCFATATRQLEMRVAPLRKDVGAVGCALVAGLKVASELSKSFLT
jgi:N-acetylglucosamine repressor